MLCLLFQAKKTQFIIDTSYIVEIIHRVNLQELDTINPYFKGFINFRGELVPLMDFCEIYSGEPTEPCMHARLVIIRSLDNRKIALLAENVLQTLKVHKNEFIETSEKNPERLYITGMWDTSLGIVKYIDVPLLFHICYQEATYG